MPSRAMNNSEKEAAKILKENGFHVFSEYSGGPLGGSQYWAKHPKLFCQYHIGTNFNQAMNDLKNITNPIKPENNQLTLNL